jgi:hypothetical protein
LEDPQLVMGTYSLEVGSRLMARTHLGTIARFLLHSIVLVLKWGALSDERTGLQCTIAAGLDSTVILGYECRRTHDHILLSQI